MIYCFDTPSNRGEAAPNPRIASRGELAIQPIAVTVAAANQTEAASIRYGSGQLSTCEGAHGRGAGHRPSQRVPARQSSQHSIANEPMGVWKGSISCYYFPNRLGKPV
jgi:hypothetical protein